MDHAKGVLPDPVIRDYRAHAMLVFADIDPALDSAGIARLMKELTGVVETARGDRGPDGEPVTSVAVAVGAPFFFGQPATPRAGIDPARIPLGLVEAVDLGPTQETLQHALLFYVMTTSEQAFVEFMQELSKRRGSGLTHFAVERGFQRKDRREMFGFRDGLRNPGRDERPDIAFVDHDNAPWEPDSAIGGSYLAYLKIEQQFDAFRAMQPSEQEQAMGRRLQDGSRLDQPAGTNVKAEGPFADTTVPLTAHVRKAGPRIDAAHDAVRIFRRGVPYSEVDANGAICGGLQFVSFQWSPDTFSTIFRRWMLNPTFPPGAGGNDALVDRGLMTIRKGGLFFVPGEDSAKDGFIGSSFLKPARPQKPAKEGKLVVRKTVGDPTVSLAGISFQLVNPADGAPVGAPFVTNAAGHAQSDKVPAGSYLLRETAPATFQPVGDQTVNINQGSTPLVITNTVVQGGYR